MAITCSRAVREFKVSEAAISECDANHKIVQIAAIRIEILSAKRDISTKSGTLPAFCSC